MPRAGRSVYRVSLRGAGRRASEFSRLQRAIQDELVAELRQFGREGERLFRAAAPKDTRNLAGAIRAVPFFRAIRPRVRVAVERLDGHQGEGRDGFDYLAVTRRGHRRSVIVPREARALKVHVEGHRNAQIYEFRQAVRGSRPASDWVVDAAQRADRVAALAERRLARRIESRVLR